jgi:hypothetical protein
MLLLRGEAVAEHPKEHHHVVESRASRPEVPKAISSSSSSHHHKSRAVTVEQNNQLHTRQVQLQQRIEMLKSKQGIKVTK